jgi:hypothetical protein
MRKYRKLYPPKWRSCRNGLDVSCLTIRVLICNPFHGRDVKHVRIKAGRILINDTDWLTQGSYIRRTISVSATKDYERCLPDGSIDMSIYAELY